MRITSNATLKVLGAGLLVATTGCSFMSSLNPFASKPSTRNQPAALVEVKTTATVRTVWSERVGKADQYVFTPAVVGGDVFTAAADGTVMRINAATGRSVWSINAGSKLTAGVGSDGDTIVVAGEKGTVLAFDGNGKQRWKAQASSEVLSTPAVGQGVVIVRSLDNRVVALDAETGARKWFVQRTTPALTLRTSPGITIANSNAYVGLAGGRLLAVTLNNGAPRWEIAVGDPRGTTELERIADISGAPVVSGRDVCAVAYQGRVACFDAISGTPRWAKALSSDVGVAVDERFVYAADERGALNAFERDGGVSAWRNNQLANRRLSTPISSSRLVAVGDYQGYIHFFSKENGLLAARISTDGSPILAAPANVGANFIFQTQSGTLVAVAAE
ncbi:Putative outer membrane lipoprotein [Herminiimonas arsenicoxydans]|uniref:Outer membrane protein assembly factor BamB n=1 Tax=Herminiimonas arsenicoxydans TaxID=204773 RepID=A4G4K5_HERAR|nr:Putative outer membrane lipoprotein [Herminiimonas arsenicoxydans]